ncbi:MAG: Hsp20/alpha crystallin family protein [Fimbriimonas ginsengisoli]|uniref:Hsp20/alpha crystallin family protein n=1 Tax=Fimbriimonas ginsengisoli TaxID=1005039 RepID=A0A931LTV6_FIMGI|nr:Hsp20/alpha crystallin family protein [Fimbriimonas ginsengisoli]
MLTRWMPTDRMRSFERFNKMMEDVLGVGGEEFRGAWMPTVDIKETPNEIFFFCELPGVRESDIEVEFVGDFLTIKGKREFADEARREDYVRVERSYGTFQRSFTLDVPVRSKDVTATFKDGVLTVTVPKAENVQPHRVEVKKT